MTRIVGKVETAFRPPLSMETASHRDPGPLRIGVITSTYPRSDEDYEVPWLRESVNRIAARGHELTVIAPSYSGLKSHMIDGIEVRRFRYAPTRLEKLTHGEGAPNKLKKNPFLKVLTLTYLLSGIWSVWRICREKRIDVLHVHWPFPHGLMALLPAWLGRVQIVSSCHGAEIALAARNRLSTALLASCLRCSTAVTANSSHTANLIRKISGRDAQVIPYGATVRIDQQPCSRSNEVPLLLFSGRLIPRKGVNYLLKAIPLILAERQARLVITGDGYCRAEWEALSRGLGVADRVEFAGFVSNERLSELFRSCAIYVHPAIYDDRGDTEGLGVVLIEALRNSRPVVASEVGGIVDVIKDEETGLLVPEKDPAAIANAVLRLLDDSVLARRLGEQGNVYAAQFFDWDRITDQLEAVYRRLCPLCEPPLPVPVGTGGDFSTPTMKPSMAVGSRILRSLRLAAPWLALGCVVLALVPRSGELRQCLYRLNAGMLTMAIVLCLVYRLLNAGVWTWILGSLGYRVPYIRGMRVWLTAESLRWLPGSIWGFCSRVDGARTLGVPATIASISLPLELIVTIASWSIVAAVGLYFSGVGGQFLAAGAKWLPTVCATAIVGPIVLSTAWPVLARQSWFRTGLERAQALCKLRFNRGSLLRSALFYTALNAVNGLGFWFILTGMGYGRIVSPALAICVNAIGWLIGFFAIGVPGGIGVREAGAALLLIPVMPWPEAILACVLWRVVQIVAELASLLPWLFVTDSGGRAKVDTLVSRTPPGAGSSAPPSF
jgi:glycosyltransferase involved in cell wall biosynthesis